jgi:hypothetical protein
VLNGGSVWWHSARLAISCHRDQFGGKRNPARPNLDADSRTTRRRVIQAWLSPLNVTDPLGRAQRGRGDPPRPAQAQAIAAHRRCTSPPDPSSRASPSTSVSHRSWRTGPARSSRTGHNLRAWSCRTATVGRGRLPSPLAAGWITARVEAAHSLVVEGLLVGVVVAVKHPVRFGLASQPQL